MVKKKKDRLKYVLEVSELEIFKQDNLYEVQYRSETGQGIIACSVVLYAVGFGNETTKNEPYWRNDQLGQSDVDFTGSEKIKYVVSGVGDGGLVDVFRLTIRDFRHDQIFSETFGPPESPLLEKLRQLQMSRQYEDGWLYDQFNSIADNDTFKLTNSLELLKARRRSDTDVILNGTARNFRRILRLDHISLSNALLIYCLYKIGAIKYVSASLNATGKSIRTRKGSSRPQWLRGAKVFIRHGTKRDKALIDAGCGAAIPFMKQQKELRDSGQPIYPTGWWGQYTRPADAANPSRAPHKIEFVPPGLMTHATMFVSTLGNILRQIIDTRETDGTGNRQFRVTLHRLVRFDGDEVFQQITPYVGRVEDTSGLGRFFKVEGGIVGLTCRTGRLVVVKKEDEATFDEIWRLTELGRTGAKPIKPYVDSLFACPIFAPEDGTGLHYVSLVLFVDSAESDFFDDEVLGTISAACGGFVKVLDLLNSSGALKSLPSFYPGFRVRADKDIQAEISKLKKLGVSFRDMSDAEWKDQLTFKTLKSLDFELGTTMEFS